MTAEAAPLTGAAPAPRRRVPLVGLAALLIGALVGATLVTRAVSVTRPAFVDFEEETGPNGDDPAGGIDYAHITASIGYQEVSSTPSFLLTNTYWTTLSVLACCTTAGRVAREPGGERRGSDGEPDRLERDDQGAGASAQRYVPQRAVAAAQLGVLQGSTLLRCWCLFLFFRGIYISAHPFQGTPPITSNVVRGLILSLTKEHTYATWRWNHSGPGPANRQDQINATTAASAVVNAARVFGAAPYRAQNTPCVVFSRCTSVRTPQ